MKTTKPTLLSVWITTYNHEKYIAQALDSVLMQQTNFDFEIIVGEDCSQDRTREIVLMYQQQHPEKIKLFLPERNLGMKAMFAQTYKMCTGKYHAWMDGDDFWTDPLKLQKQVDLMEANEEVVMCFHGCEILVEDDGKLRPANHPRFAFDSGGIITLEDLLAKDVTIQTPSVVVRNILPADLPSWFYTLPYLDRGIYYLLLQHGKALYLSEGMAIYRKHGGGAWSGLQKKGQLQQSINFYQTLKNHIKPVVAPHIKRRLRRLARQKLRLELKAKNPLGILLGTILLCRNLF